MDFKRLIRLTRELLANHADYYNWHDRHLKDEYKRLPDEEQTIGIRSELIDAVIELEYTLSNHSKDVIMVIPKSDLGILSGILDFAEEMSNQELEFYKNEGVDWVESKELEQNRNDNIVRLKQFIKDKND